LETLLNGLDVPVGADQILQILEQACELHQPRQMQHLPSLFGLGALGFIIAICSTSPAIVTLCKLSWKYTKTHLAE